MIKSYEVIVHFSGGTDSTLAAALYLEKGYHVHLITYDRHGFVGSRGHSQQNFHRLKERYGNVNLTRKVINIESLHKFICYKNYLSLVKKFGLAATSLCFSKLAMHFYSCAYAIKNNITIVVDGAVPYMKMYPDQNPHISLNLLKTFYSDFEIYYENPVFSISDAAESLLYDMGVTPFKKVRGTTEDKQVYYIEQVFLAFFLKYYNYTQSFEKYERDMRCLYHNRISLMKDEIQGYFDKDSGASILQQQKDLAFLLQ